MVSVRKWLATRSRLRAAMAARMAHPSRPVVAFTGDGSFMMAIAELHTSVREWDMSPDGLNPARRAKP